MDIAKLGFSIDSRTAQSATANLNTLTGAAGRAERGTEKMARSIERDVARMNSVLGKGAALFVGYFSVQALTRFAQGLARVADGYANVQAKLKLVTDGQESLARTSREVFAISQRTFTSLDATATLVARTTRALVSNGAASEVALQKSLALSETIQQAFAVSGATGQEATNAIIQLSQGLAAGALRGEEFNSIAEQGPRIMQALAASLGKSTGELRALAAEGKLTAEVIIRALTDQAAAIQGEFANLPLTIERSLVVLSNSWTQFIGALNESQGVSVFVAEAFKAIAEALDIVGPQLIELIDLWAKTTDKQDETVISAETIGQAMKVVVTGLVLGKNAVEVFISGLELLGRIAAATVKLIIGNFEQMANLLPRLAQRVLNPFAAFDDADLFAGIAEGQAKLWAEFTREAGGAIDDFAAKAKKDVADVTNVFEFLLKPVQKIPGEVKPAAAAVDILGKTAAMSQEEVVRLANALRQFEDFLGRIRGDIDPLTRIQEEYNKTVREGLALADKAIRAGADEVRIRKELGEALTIAARNRDRETAAVVERQRSADILLADMDLEIALLGMNERQRREHLAVMAAEEAMRRAISEAQAAGLTLSEAEIAALMEAAKLRALTIEGMRDVSDAADRAAREFESIWESAADGVGDALTTALFDGAKSGADAVMDAMETLARDLVRYWIQQRIVIPLQYSMTGGPGAAGGAAGGIGSIFSGFSNNFGRPTGLTNANGSMNWGNIAQLGLGAFGVFQNFRNGPGGLSGGLSGALQGASGGAALGGVGAIVGAIIGGLSGLFGGAKPPDFRLGATGRTRKPEGSFTTDLGSFTFGARGLEGGESQLVAAVQDFDRTISELVGGVSGGSEQLQRIRDALSQWAIDLRGDAVTAENVLGQRFSAILATFDADVQQFVRGAGDLQAQVQALAEYLARPDQLRDLLDALRLEDQLAGMTQLERQVFGVNQAFDQAAAQAAALGASQAQLAEIEELRASALGRLTTAQSDAIAQTVRDAERIGAVLGDLLFESMAAGMSDLELELAETTRRFADLESQLRALGASEKEIAELRQREAEALGRIIAANAAAEMERIAEATQSLAQIITGIDAQIADLGAASDYQRALLGIGRSLRDNINQLNAAARAAGLQAAREEDLARAHQLAAAQAAQALATLTAAGQQQAAQLYGTALGDIEQRIAELSRVSGGALGGFGDAIRETAQAASDATRLLLGDLSPLKDAQKLPLALQALQRGEIGQEDVLRIAQRLYASGSDYNRVFAQVQAIGDRRGTGSIGTATPAEPMVDPRLAQLYAERDRLLAEQAQAARFGQAQTLAQTIADISGTRGESFASVLSRLSGGRGTLEQLAADLQLGGIKPLEEFLRSLQAGAYGPADIAAQITAGEQLIVDTLREIGGLDGGEFVKPGSGALLKESLAEYAQDDPIRAENAEMKAIMQDVRDALREIRERLPEAVEAGTDATVGALHQIAARLERPLAGELPTDPRSLRKPGRFDP